jgi:hypothetical protein
VFCVRSVSHTIPAHALDSFLSIHLPQEHT